MDIRGKRGVNYCKKSVKKCKNPFSAIRKKVPFYILLRIFAILFVWLYFEDTDLVRIAHEPTSKVRSRNAAHTQDVRNIFKIVKYL